MATHLDLQEQEQLDALKAFWKQYGNLIVWVLILVLGSFAAWQGWNRWQGSVSAQASAVYEELEKAVQAGDTDKTARIFSDLTERYGRTAYAQQGALLAAKLQYEKGKPDAAQAALNWAIEHGDDQYQAIARLRLAGVLLDQKKPDEAMKQVDAVQAPEFAALASDRRGDVLMVSGKQAEAKAAYESAWKAMPETLDYRRLVEAKLAALGAAVPASAASAAGAQP